MSKIICDICGTSYADTATQCPICGCVRPAEPQPVPEEENNSSAYTYVKGGRFLKSNVKKRAASEPKQPKEEKSGKKTLFCGNGHLQNVGCGYPGRWLAYADSERRPHCCDGRCQYVSAAGGTGVCLASDRGTASSDGLLHFLCCEGFPL